MRRLLPWFFVAALAPLANSQVAGDDDPPKPEVIVRPGAGPQIPFDEARWEFWWYFNREPYLRLRPALFALAEESAESDVPFYRLTQDDREQSVVPTLVMALRDKNPAIRMAALHAVAKTQDEGARPPLRAGIKDAQFLVRLQAISAYGVYGSTVFLTMLEDVVNDDTRTLQERAYAALSIGLIGGSSVTESFKQILAPSSFHTLPTQLQAGLAAAIGLPQSPDNAALVRALLESKNVNDPDVRAHLTVSLGKCGAPADLDFLVKLLSDDQTQIRRSAAIGIGNMMEQRRRDPAVATVTVTGAVTGLIQASREDADIMVKNFSYIALGKIGGEDAARHLRSDLEGVAKNHRPFVALAVGILGDEASVPLLLRHFERETENSYRGALAIAIGLHRNPDAIPALRKAFDGQLEPVFRGHVALALGMCKDVEAIERLTQVFGSATDVEFVPNAATALGLLGARDAVTTLSTRAVKEKNEFVKQTLIYSLGLIGDRSALPTLTGFATDAGLPAYVRALAVTAIGQIADPQPTRAIARLTSDFNYTIRSDFLQELFRVL